MVRAFLTRSSRPGALTGWRGLPMLAFFALFLIALPQARALVAAGLAGGVVLGGLLILIRHHSGSSGPRRGTPIVLFPRRVEVPIVPL
jgi:hypothetical protein